MSITPHSRPYLILKPTQKLPIQEQLGPDFLSLNHLIKNKRFPWQPKWELQEICRFKQVFPIEIRIDINSCLKERYSSVQQGQMHWDYSNCYLQHFWDVLTGFCRIWFGYWLVYVMSLSVPLPLSFQVNCLWFTLQQSKVAAKPEMLMASAAQPKMWRWHLGPTKLATAEMIRRLYLLYL